MLLLEDKITDFSVWNLDVLFLLYCYFFDIGVLEFVCFDHYNLGFVCFLETNLAL